MHKFKYHIDSILPTIVQLNLVSLGISVAPNCPAVSRPYISPQPSAGNVKQPVKCKEGFYLSANIVNSVEFSTGSNRRKASKGDINDRVEFSIHGLTSHPSLQLWGNTKENALKIL